VATASETLNESAEIAGPAPEISFRARFGLFAAAWGIATIATAGFSPLAPQLLFIFAWLFPAGLLGLFVSPDWEPPGGLTILVVGWLLYIGWSIYLLAQRKRARFFVAYAYLLVFLLFNVAGCHMQMRQPFKIGC